MIHAQMSFSAVIPLYWMNPSTAKGRAARMQIQLSVSMPKTGRRRKYNPTATAQASTENTNCLSVSPKNTVSE